MNNEIIEEKKSLPDDSKQARKKKINMKKLFSISNICFTLTVVFVIIAALTISNTIRKGGESAQIAYEKAKNKASEEAYNKFYDTAFSSAERKYHVSNKISIEVASVKEKSDLEVLKVSDVEYVIQSGNDNKDGIEVWMEYYGEGVYNIDMRASEFIIDSDRQYVLVRVPRPELQNIHITDANELWWKNGIFDKSESKGVDLAQDLRNEGYALLNNYMKSNPRFYKSAKDSALIVISDLIKGLNPEVPNLVVDIEFVD